MATLKRIKKNKEIAKNSKKIKISRSIPCDDSWDVLVAGGGPAGCTAAAAAARAGARVLLIEATGALGGMGTSGLIPAWCPFSDKKEIIYRGLAQRILEQCKAGMPFVPKAQIDWVPIDPELLKRIYDDLLAEFGATVRFHTFLSGVEVDTRGRVKAVLVSDKTGLRAIRAKIYIDCTGDGDLATWAGAPYEIGDGRGGAVQPSTHCFILSNVDTRQYDHMLVHTLALKYPDIFEKISSSGKYPHIRDWHACNNIVGAGTIGFNAGHLWNIDSTDPDSVSRALPEGRKLALEFRNALAEFLPDIFGNSHLAQTAPLMGIRESRRILGEYRLTIADYLARREFPDSIGRNSYPVDIHQSIEEIPAYLAGKLRAMHRFENYAPGESHAIPYRALIPKKLKNVLVAGRCISCDHDIQGSIRVMPVCLVMGEAAGTAAAIAATKKLADTRQVPIPTLRRNLQKFGALL